MNNEQRISPEEYLQMEEKAFPKEEIGKNANSPYFFDLKEQASKTIFPGVTITPVWGEEIMMSFVQFEFANALVPTHSHPHEQMGMGLEGEFELVIDGESRTIRKGDSYWIPSNIPHSAKSITDSARALDIFHPVREEYK